MEESEYDFYICHHEDDNFLAQKFVSKLELMSNCTNLRGFHEDRDANQGQSFLKVMEQAIEKSKYVILLVTKSALKNSLFEMKMHASLQHRIDNPMLMNTVIPVYVNDGTRHEESPPSLRVIVGIEYTDDDLFWEKLHRTLCG